MTISEYKKEKAKLLVNSPSPILDMDCLLQYFLKKNKTWLLTHADEELESVVGDASIVSKIDQAVEKRKTGLPIAYITETKEFYGLDFYVNKNVLIPKPDTEILVEKAIQLINENHFKTVADICTGSGCIAVSIAKNVASDVKFYATDVSHLALEIAEKNAFEILGKKIADENFKFLLGEVLWPLIENEDENINNEQLDLIVTNPPYIPRLMVNQLLRDGRNEPILALDGDACYTNPLDENYGDGMSVIRPIISQSIGKLKDGGYFLCETGEYNSDATVELCRINGFTNIQVLKDLEGSPRVVFAQKAGGSK